MHAADFAAVVVCLLIRLKACTDTLIHYYCRKKAGLLNGQ